MATSTLKLFSRIKKEQEATFFVEGFLHSLKAILVAFPEIELATPPLQESAPDI